MTTPGNVDPKTIVPAASPGRVRISRGRRVAYAVVAMALALVVAAGALLAVDVYLHRKFERTAGYNVWGYRGPAVGRKQRDEFRVVVLGGSAAYGYGRTWDQAIPAVLEENLTGRTAGPFHRFTVVNLGYNNEGAYSFRFTLNDYQWLKYDLAVLYEGYNDLTGDYTTPNLSVFRHDSPVFRLTGYLPIFPMVFKEKAALMRTGTVKSLYRDAPKTVFRPGLAAKAAAGVLSGAADVGQSLEQQLGRVMARPVRHIDDPASTGCTRKWQAYCRSEMVAIDFALQQGAQVLIATQPYGAGPMFHALHSDQQAQLAAMIARRYGGNPRVRYVNFGDAVDLDDPDLSFDHMHLTETGNARIAARLVQPVLEMATWRATAQP
jgi:hypothetical protein